MKQTIRIGHGYDIHRLVPGRRLVLGGVTIDYRLGLDGHSDADVVCHAVMDSLLGAAALGDIGQHFPSSDLTYKDADSIELLKKVGGMISNNGYSIGNIDVTVIAEQPGLAEHIESMKRNIANAVGMSAQAVSVKATSNETIGAIGRGEGIAAFAVTLLIK